jgi:hypothetical protein
MLHFVFGCAVCIWVGECVWRRLRAWGYQRRYARNLRENLRSQEQLGERIDERFWFGAPVRMRAGSAASRAPAAGQSRSEY